VGIVDEDVVKVRDLSDIVGIVTQYVQLKRVGTRFVGLCPFHAEKSPSFSVNQQEGFWYCFGACHRGGDVISFVREIEHLDFVGAVEWLAGKAGVTLRYTERAEGEGRRQRTRLVDAMQRAVDWYHERLLTAPDAGPARAYLRDRGLDGKVVRDYRIGWAPEAWDELARALRLPDDVMTGTGLGFLNKGGRQTDAFRARILFPIFDASGDPVAFGGRAMPGADGPKYKNSPETAVYSKSKVLYGLNWAKGDIVSADEVIVCEGYTDVIGFAQAGVPRAVATCGTALTEEHLRLLGKFARRVVLAFDADAAGQQAADRVYAWEKSLDLAVAVAALPTGVDPADLAHRDPEALRKSVEQAVPFLGFRVERALTAAELSSPEGRARAAETALAVIAEHPSDLVRDQYVMEVADRCRLDPDQLRARMRGVGAKGARAGAKLLPVDRAPVTSTLRDTPETEALRLAIHRPEDVAPWLHEVLFDGERHAAVYRALASAATLHDALESADPGAAELLLRLAVEESDAEPIDVIVRLLQEATTRELRMLDAEVRHAEEFASYSRASADVKMALERLREPETRTGAAEQLLAWLVARSEERA